MEKFEAKGKLDRFIVSKDIPPNPKTLVPQTEQSIWLLAFRSLE